MYFRLLLTMPAYDEQANAMATKVVTVYPENRQHNFPSIHATVLLHDVTNGRLKAVQLNICVQIIMLQ